MNIIWKHVLRSAGASKGQAAVIMVTVVMVTLMIFAAFSMNSLFFNIIMVENNRTAQGADMLLGRSSGGDYFSSAKVESLISGDSRVDYVEYFFKFGSVLRTPTSKEILVEATDLDEYVIRHNLRYVKKLTTPAAYSSVIISQRMAQNLGVSVGDTLEIFSVRQSRYTKYTVTYIAENEGIFASPRSLNVLVDISTVDSLGMVTSVYFKFNDPAAFDEYTEIFANEFAAINCSEADNRTRATQIAANNTLLYEVGMVFIIGLMMMILYTSFIIISKKRLQELVLFKAAGATPAAIVGIMLAESLLYGVVGSAIGVPIGAILLALAVKLFLPAVTGAITYSVLQFLVAMLAGIVVCLVAALLPAARVAKKTVRELTAGAIKAVKYHSPHLAAVAFVVLVGLVVAVNFVSGYLIIALTILMLPVLALLIALALPYLIKAASRLVALVGLKTSAALSAFSVKKNAPTHTVSLLLAVVIALAFMCVSVIQLVLLAITPYNSRYSGDLTVKVVQNISTDQARALQADLLAIDGTESVAFYRQYSFSLSKDDDIFYSTNVYGVGTAESVQSISTSKISAETLAKFVQGTAIVNEEISRKCGLNVGDYFYLSRAVSDSTQSYEEYVDGKFLIVGVENTVTEYDSVLFINLADATVSAQPISGETIFLANSDGLRGIDELFADYRQVVDATDLLAYVLFFNDWAFAAISGLEGVQSILLLLQILVIGVSSLSIVNIIIVTYFDRRNEYKIYRFCGLSEDDFVRLAAGESFVLALSGGVAGILSAFIINQMMPILGIIVEKYLTYPIFPLNALLIALAGCIIFAGVWVLVALANRRQFRATALFNEQLRNL